MNGEGANGECEMEGVGVDESDEGDGGCQRLGCNRRRSFSGPAFPSHPFGPLSLDTHIQSIYPSSFSFLFNSKDAITHSRSSCSSHLHPRILQHFPSCPVHRGRRSFKVQSSVVTGYPQFVVQNCTLPSPPIGQLGGHNTYSLSSDRLSPFDRFVAFFL